MIDIKGISGATPASVAPSVSGAPGKASGTGFGEIFSKAIDAVNGQAQEAEKLVTGLVSGEHANIHETMIAMEKSSISFRMLTKAQSKAIDAYQEIMRMQL